MTSEADKPSPSAGTAAAGRGIYAKFRVWAFAPVPRGRGRKYRKTGASFILDLVHDQHGRAAFNSVDGLRANAGTVDPHNAFIVERTDGRSKRGEKHHSCTYYVIDLRRDPLWKRLLTVYADSCAKDFPMLARELRDGVAAALNWWPAGRRW